MVNMVLPEELPEELNILFDIMPLKLFELFFDDVIIDFIIKITNLYEQQSLSIWDKSLPWNAHFKWMQCLATL